MENIYRLGMIEEAVSEEGKAFLPDFSVTVIRKASEEIKEGDWLYYEQDDFVITLANYLHGKMGMDRIEQLSCRLCIPETDNNAECP